MFEVEIFGPCFARKLKRRGPRLPCPPPPTLIGYAHYILFLRLNLLNKSNELVLSKCRHENKYYLRDYKSIIHLHCPLNLSKKLFNQLSSTSYRNGYPWLSVIFVNMIMCRNCSAGVSNVYIVLSRISYHLKIARSVKLILTTLVFLVKFLPL